VKTKYKQKVDDFLNKTGSQLLLLIDEGVPHTVIMVRDNRCLSVLTVKSYTTKEQSKYDLFKQVQIRAKDLALGYLLSEKEIKELISIKE
jgi:hypothetical protein